METVIKKLYEGLFLVDSAKAVDWEVVNGAVRKILDRSDAEVVSLKKWDERRLAYKISDTTRGTYILCYFRADGNKIQQIERDIQLSETIYRALILNAEQQPQESLQDKSPEKSAEPAPVDASEKQQQQGQSEQQMPEEADEQSVEEVES